MAARTVFLAAPNAAQEATPAANPSNGMTKSEAELLLDRLEYSGVHNLEVRAMRNGLFVVASPSTRHRGKQQRRTASLSGCIALFTERVSPVGRDSALGVGS